MCDRDPLDQTAGATFSFFLSERSGLSAVKLTPKARMLRGPEHLAAGALEAPAGYR